MSIFRKNSLRYIHIMGWGWLMMKASIIDDWYNFSFSFRIKYTEFKCLCISIFSKMSKPLLYSWMCWTFSFLSMQTSLNNFCCTLIKMFFNTNFVWQIPLRNAQWKNKKSANSFKPERIVTRNSYLFKCLEKYHNVARRSTVILPAASRQTNNVANIYEFCPHSGTDNICSTSKSTYLMWLLPSALLIYIELLVFCSDTNHGLLKSGII